VIDISRTKSSPVTSTESLLSPALVFALLIAAALYLASRVLDHLRMSDYGFHFSRKWWTDLGFGLVLGALLLFGVLAVELAAGWVKVTGSFAPSPGQPFVATIQVCVVAVAAIAFGEEASYRGYRSRTWPRASPKHGGGWSSLS
jgi:hypothetical protein